MSSYQDALQLARMNNKWDIIEQERDPDSDALLTQTEVAYVYDLDLWEGLQFKQHVIVVKELTMTASTPSERLFVLMSTKRYTYPGKAVERYRLRVKIEERFRQFKHDWYIGDFPSPHRALIESHVCFTLLTYSLLQLYLRKKDLQEKTAHMMGTLKRDEQVGKDSVLVYAKHKYGVFDLDDYTVRVAGMQETPRQKLITIMEAQKAARLKRESAP